MIRSPIRYPYYLKPPNKDWRLTGDQGLCRGLCVHEGVECWVYLDALDTQAPEAKNPKPQKAQNFPKSHKAQQKQLNPNH